MPLQPDESIQQYASRLGVDLSQQPVETLLNLIEEVQLMKLVLAKLIKQSKVSKPGLMVPRGLRLPGGDE